MFYPYHCLSLRLHADDVDVAQHVVICLTWIQWAVLFMTFIKKHFALLPCSNSNRHDTNEIFTYLTIYFFERCTYIILKK